jgi:ABC-type transport system involved in multi-copper enzyme maturation permease subunit
MYATRTCQSVIRLTLLTGQFLRLIGKNRPVLLLVAVFLLIGPITIGVRFLAVQSFQTPTTGNAHVVLLEAPNPQKLGMFLGALQSGVGIRRDLPGCASALFSATVGRSTLTISSATLDDVYLFIVPLLALLIGGNVLPHDERVYGILFSLPTRKGWLYVYQAVALFIFIVLLVGVAFLANFALISWLYQSGWAVISMLGEYHLAVCLFALVFAFLGLVLSVLFRERSAALALGLTIVVLMTAVIPPVQSVLGDVYARTHMTELVATKAEDKTPTDLFYKTVDFLSLTPSCAFTNILDDLSALYAADKEAREGCVGCQSQENKRRRIVRRYLALLTSSGVCLLLGGVAFVRKEAQTT